MRGYTTQPGSREGSGLWLIKIGAGLLIVVLMTVHFIINHAVVPGGLLSYDDVINYYNIWFIPIMEGIFLVVIVVHMLLGLRSILLDLNPSTRISKSLDIVFMVLGIGMISYGIWLLVTVASIG